jgi:hypothetical protein
LSAWFYPVKVGSAAVCYKAASPAFGDAVGWDFAYKREDMRILVFISLAFALLPISANAMSCEQFRAAINEGAAIYQTPTPTFHVSHANSVDPYNKYWDIFMFDDARAMVSCWRGSVNTFAASASDSQSQSSLHLALLMAMALHGYGLEWRAALLIRDKLVSTAEVSNPHIARISFGAHKASLIVSIASVPNFRIDTR